MASNTHIVQLTGFRNLSPWIRSFELRVAEGDRLEFQAGQYVSMEFVLDGESHRRAYSVACPPSGGRRLEILARHNPAGAGTRYLWGMEPGFRFPVSGPFGTFCLQRKELRDSLFVASGTGISPVRSMLHTLLRERTDARAILLFGVRDQQDLLYHSEFLELAERTPDFFYRPVLSRPLNGWPGLQGHVQEHFEAALDRTRPVDVYFAGLPAMVADIRRILEESNFDPSAIHYERY